MSGASKITIKRNRSSHVKLSLTISFDGSRPEAADIWRNVGLVIGSVLTEEERAQFVAELKEKATAAGIRVGGAS